MLKHQKHFTLLLCALVFLYTVLSGCAPQSASHTADSSAGTAAGISTASVTQSGSPTGFNTVSAVTLPAYTLPVSSPTPTLSPAVSQTPVTTVSPTLPAVTVSAAPSPAPANTPQDLALAEFSFPDKFSQDTAYTENSYISPNVNLELKKHETVINSSKVTYYVIDIYVRSLECFAAGIAYTQSGSVTRETTPALCSRYGAVAAISGDFFNFRDSGRIVRNGQVLKNKKSSEDVCALYVDGVMETYSPDEFDMNAALERGLWQSWGFGPALLGSDGMPLKSFNSTVNTRNPRSAVGYYEPGHYCFVTVDGRQSGYSAGMTMAQLADLFYQMGCKAAFNLDGGQTAVMAWMGETANIPYKGGRRVSDILMILDIGA
ncbi:MAG: phosphodiester glycosidase family protein [Firmicutes bacterium]|nr:phosphodiester glycosidase family protein [Bacillota bacterium]